VSSIRALEILDAADVPAGPVNSIADMVQDPHFQSRGMFETLPVNGEDRLMPAVHPRLEQTPASSRWAGPELGEHTDEVLRSWLDAARDDIAAWRESRLL